MGRSPEGRTFRGPGFFEVNKVNRSLILYRGWASTGRLDPKPASAVSWNAIRGENARGGHRVDTTSD